MNYSKKWDQSHTLYLTYTLFYPETYSRISPGWQFKASQMASKVLNRMAFAFPVFRIERFGRVMSTVSANSESDIFRLASITSKFTIMGIFWSLNC